MKALNFSVTPSKIPVADIVAAACSQQRKPIEREAIKSSKKDGSIVILSADKGRTTVILDKQDYHNKVSHQHVWEIHIRLNQIHQEQTHSNPEGLA